MHSTVSEFWICATCAVEHSERVASCAICADERQWVPEGGQRWTTLDELRSAGIAARLEDLEPNLWGIATVGDLGIGQQSKLLRTPEGSLLFDPIGYVDDVIAGAVMSLGPVRAIVASHPHMFGVQVEWSRRLGGVPVLISDQDRSWVARADPAIEYWSGDMELLPGVTLTQPGGHFPGSAAVHWASGADGRGVILTGDTIYANPDRKSVGFMRSYPNFIPLSGPVAQRVAAHVCRFEFDRLYGNFTEVIRSGARAIVSRSADRHAEWTSGRHDEST